jgi:hypothetical protein
VALGGRAGGHRHSGHHQVIAFLAAVLNARGCTTVYSSSQITYKETALLADPRAGRPLDVLVRFYQGEWLARADRHGWPRLPVPTLVQSRYWCWNPSGSRWSDRLRL